MAVSAKELRGCSPPRDSKAVLQVAAIISCSQYSVVRRWARPTQIGGPSLLMCRGCVGLPIGLRSTHGFLRTCGSDCSGNLSLGPRRRPNNSGNAQGAHDRGNRSLGDGSKQARQTAIAYFAPCHWIPNRISTLPRRHLFGRPRHLSWVSFDIGGDRLGLLCRRPISNPRPASQMQSPALRCLRVSFEGQSQWRLP